MQTLETAMAQLQHTLNSTRPTPSWRGTVRQGLSSVRDALGGEQFRSWDGWLNARSKTSDRERVQLLARISAIGPAVVDRLDAEAIRGEIDRLLRDVEHYRQRMHDLIYDSVALEIGGSE